ncbi:MAG: acetolactate synthase large subunit [Coriobacteriales bacterium]|jgi:acetolactate synthase-1/2/3 large subunit|nr:acetolactate synthase large subunit [Coriobacteriales bacterium]
MQLKNENNSTNKEMLNGAQIVVRSLIAQRTDIVFGYPGGQVLDIYDELYKHSDKIKHVISAHEQGAAHAADGYARATGKVGVVLATSGPGATNLVTGIATAYLDSVPMVAITGNVATALLGKDSFQEVDILGITIPVTKQNYIVKDINELAHTLREAFAIAKNGRPGPVLIDIPRDVQTASCECTIVADEDMLAYSHTSKLASNNSKAASQASKADSQTSKTASQSNTTTESSTHINISSYVNQYTSEQLAAVVALLNISKRPYIYCGGGVLAACAEEDVMRFAQQIDACIGCSMMGLTAIPASHPRNLGMTGMHGREAAIRAKDRADLVIGIGVRFSDRATGNKAHYTAGTRFIHIDIDAAEIDKNISVDASLVGDIKQILGQLCALLPARELLDWRDEIAGFYVEEQQHLAAQRGQSSGCVSASTTTNTSANTAANDAANASANTTTNASTSSLTPQEVIAAVRKRASDSTLVATDVGQHQMWVAQSYGFQQSRRFLTSGGLGTMGFGLGAAIGGCMGLAAMAETAPQKTILFTGDGSFGMNLNEMATAVSQNLPIVVVIMNNGVLGMVRQWQNLFYEQRYSSTTLARATDFVALARAFGADGCCVNDALQLESALDAAFAATGPYVVDCCIDADDKVFPMIPPGGTVNDMLLG